LQAEQESLQSSRQGLVEVREAMQQHQKTGMLLLALSIKLFFWQSCLSVTSCWSDIDCVLLNIQSKSFLDLYNMLTMCTQHCHLH